MEHPDFGFICECECHQDGSTVICGCFGECCGRTGKEYISADGVVDIKRFGALIMEERLRAKGK